MYFDNNYIIKNAYFLKHFESTENDCHKGYMSKVFVIAVRFIYQSPRSDTNGHFVFYTVISEVQVETNI